MAVNPRLLEILVCPICKGNLELDASRQVLICKIDQLAYPIKDDIPVMLPNEATPLSELSITEPYQGDP
jgi:uncharacterized protein YbaR (Trm112 family)